jgi:hypothetical protein
MMPLGFFVSAFALLIGCVPPLAAATPTVTFAAAEYSYGENGIPTAAQVTLERDIAAGDSTVSVSFPGTGTATAGSDYNNSRILVTFSGDELTRTIDLQIVQDNIVELDETFGLTLRHLNNATIGARDSATVTIVNDDSATLSINDVAMAEGNGSGRTNFRFTVTLSNPVDVPIRFVPNLSTADPTESLIAIWDRDFFPPESPLSHTIWVMVARDSLVELDE